MLHITGSMKALKEEVGSAIELGRNILGVLNSVGPNDNLTQKVGFFVIKMPEYKILAKDAESLKKLLRRVCTGETNPNEAAIKISLGVQELCALSEKLK